MPDETIALGPWGRGQTGSGFGGMNPLSMMGDVMKLRQTQMEWNARAAFGDIAASSPDLNTALDRARQDPRVMAWAPQLMTELRNQQLLDYQSTHFRLGNAADGMQALQQAIIQAGNDPSALMPALQARFGTLPVQVQRDTLPLAQQVAKGLIGDLHGTPEEQASQYQKNRAQWMIANKFSPDEAYQSAMGTIAPRFETNLPTSTGATVSGVVGGGQPFQPVGGGQPGGSLGVPEASPGGTGPTPAPNVGTIGVGPGKTESDYMTRRGTDMAEYQKRLDANVETGSTIMQTIEEARQAMGQFKAGAGAQTYMHIAQVFQALGAKPELVDQIAGGNLAAAQEMQKLMVNTTMSQIREQIPNSSRMTQLEFKAFSENNPGIETDPRATDKVFNFWTRLYTRDRIEQRELNKYLAGGGKVTGWPEAWQAASGKMGLRDAELKSPTGTSIPAPALRHLLDNPDLASEFDKKYGAGAAEKFLGNE